jgi:CRISPR system Cascade subunit CasE
VFLSEVERNKGSKISRNTVYARWLAEKLPGADLRTFRMDAFSITEVFRSTHKASWVRRRYPDVQFSGVINVKEADLFAPVVTRGLGRQRAYGFGWLWLQRLDEVA